MHTEPSLLELLSPDNKQWLQSQTPEKQQELAKDFMKTGGIGSVGLGTNASSTEVLMGGGHLAKKANECIAMARMPKL
ncbi:hypothetical protein ACIQNI_28385 [Streptomyces sp. NPDC091266]|uniref:hypothetical protein n=1 Tax=Streptomyces sp. NPDC091266 TaxID=3365978 RepID=UPI0038192461